jgi:hypothetical protein
MTQRRAFTYRQSVMRYLVLALVCAFASMAIACKDDDGEDTNGDPTPAQSGTTTVTPTAEFCADDAVDEIVDLYVTSVHQSLAKSPGLTVSDEEGMRNDMESAVRGLCEAGASPDAKAIGNFCNGIVAAIDLRLEGDEAARNQFLTEYYDDCNKTS